MSARTPGPLVIQDLGHKPGYPDWTVCALRNAETNVHVATVGNIDRYYEGKAREHAEYIVAACNAYDTLRASLAEAVVKR